MSLERFIRYKEAYIAMAKIDHRPEALISLTEKQLRSRPLLEKEAERYAQQFLQQDEDESYPMGNPNFRVNKAFCYVIEAARLLCGVDESNYAAEPLLRMAIEEIKKAKAG